MTALEQARPIAWMCELAQEDGTTRVQFVTEDPAGIRWNDSGEPSPFKVTPLYATISAQEVPQEVPAGEWVMVPREPTQEMLAAVCPFPQHLAAEHPDTGDPWHWRMAAATKADQLRFASEYREAIAAAPAAPAHADEFDKLLADFPPSKEDVDWAQGILAAPAAPKQAEAQTLPELRLEYEDDETVDIYFAGTHVGRATYDAHGSEGMRAMCELAQAMCAALAAPAAPQD